MLSAVTTAPYQPPMLPVAKGRLAEDAAPGGALPADESGELRQAFDAFVGETFYGQMLKAMRQSVGKPAYFHGGRTEEIFQQQLDQILSQQLAQAGAAQLTDPMFELFQLSRR